MQEAVEEPPTPEHKSEHDPFDQLDSDEEKAVTSSTDGLCESDREKVVKIQAFVRMQLKRQEFREHL